MKRVFDVVVSLCGLFVLSPVMVLIAILIRRGSAGGVFFVHRRVGRFERPFRCYKFRTMASGAPVMGSHDVDKSWVTPTGRRLRRWKLDEIPQLINVLRGDMSLVGPRPCLPDQDLVIEARRRLDVFSIRPGITGPAQVASIDMSRPEELARADRAYIETKSFWGDIGLIVATLTGAGAGDAVRH